MKTYNALFALLLAAAPCAAKTQDIVLLPEGTVDARTSATSGWVSVKDGVRVRPGAEIRTGKDSKAAVLLPDGTRFQLGNDTQFAVEDTTKKKAGFKLAFGKLKASVAGYFSSRFEVRTPAAVCAVRGTEFDLEVGKDGNTEMNVAEGLVEVNDSKGKMAVVSSEERIKVGMDGMSKPESVPLKDNRAGLAARPMAVRQETARERTRTMLEELRNRELKANEAQLGKDSIDAFGKRVRLEEYLLRPSDSEFKLLFLSRRAEADRLDWGHLIERFNTAIPDDISQVGEIINGMYLSRTAPTNWMKYFEVYLTNTVDSIKETIDFTAPVQIDFRGYTGSGSADYRYYPGSIDYRQILSGPGVALAAGVGTLTNTGLSSLASDERVQFRQIQDYNVTTANEFTFTQKVVNASGVLADMYQVTLNPASAASVSGGGTATLYDPAIDPEALTPAYSNFPSGPGLADYYVRSLYADNSTVSSRKLLVSNEGEILGIGGNADSTTFLKEGSYNLEMVIDSSLFQGRNIDVLFAPEILSQKKAATTTADSLTVN
ncbi:MAG: FecR domain-containing protein [Elusimicrobia bacterium]|nr:FecR domain-containing protein [Elusimicrobiota bacterium]